MDILREYDATSARFVELLQKQKPSERGWKQPRPGGSAKADEWKYSYVWAGVSGSTVADFLRSLLVSSTAYKANGELIAQFIQKQQVRGELTSWTVALLGPDGNNGKVLGGLPINLIQRTRKEEEVSDRYVIRRVVNPRDEAIDLNENEYRTAFALTQKAFNADAGRSRRKHPPEVPSGPCIRAVRPKSRGLLLIYPLDPSKEFTAGKLRTEVYPVIGWAVSFPDSKTTLSVSYRVNNVYWAQEYGDAA